MRIWPVSQRFDRRVDAPFGFEWKLDGPVEVARHRRRRDARMGGYVAQGGVGSSLTTQHGSDRDRGTGSPKVLDEETSELADRRIGGSSGALARITIAQRRDAPAHASRALADLAGDPGIDHIAMTDVRDINGALPILLATMHAEAVYIRLRHAFK